MKIMYGFYALVFLFSIWCICSHTGIGVVISYINLTVRRLLTSVLERYSVIELSLEPRERPWCSTFEVPLHLRDVEMVMQLPAEVDISKMDTQNMTETVDDEPVPADVLQSMAGILCGDFSELKNDAPVCDDRVPLVNENGPTLASLLEDAVFRRGGSGREHTREFRKTVWDQTK